MATIDDSASDSDESMDRNVKSTPYPCSLFDDPDSDMEMDGTGTSSDPISLKKKRKQESEVNREEKAAKRRREKARRIAIKHKENSLSNLRAMAEGSMPPSDYKVSELISCLSPDKAFRTVLYDLYNEHLQKCSKSWDIYSTKIRDLMLKEVWSDTPHDNAIKKTVRPSLKKCLFTTGGNIKKWEDNEILIRTIPYDTTTLLGEESEWHADLGVCKTSTKDGDITFDQYMGSGYEVKDGNWDRITSLFNTLLSQLWLDEEKKTTPPRHGARLLGRLQFKFPHKDCAYWKKLLVDGEVDVPKVAMSFVKTMAILDFLSRRDITLVNLYDSKFKHSIVKGDLHVQFRHPAMLMAYEKVTGVGRTHVSAYGYIDKWHGNKRWPFKFSVAIEKHLEHLFQMCFLLNVWRKRDFREIFQRKVDDQWRKKCTLSYTFYNNYRFKDRVGDFELSGCHEDGKGVNRLKLKSEVEQQTTFRYSKQIVECLDRLSLLSHWLDWTSTDPVKQFEMTNLTLEQLRAVCIMSPKVLQAPFITFNRLRYSQQDLSKTDKLDYIEHLEHELKNDLKELYCFQKVLHYYIEHLDSLKAQHPSSYDILCNTKYFDTRLDSDRTILDVNPNKFPCENWFVPMLRVYNALCSIFVHEMALSCIEEQVGIFNRYFPQIDYPMELEYQTGIPAFQMYKTVYFVFGMLRELTTYYQEMVKHLSSVNTLSSSVKDRKFQSLQTIWYSCCDIDVGLMWCPSILMWYNMLRFSRVSFTGLIDPHTSRYDHGHSENCSGENKQLDFSKPMKMSFTDPISYRGFSYIPANQTTNFPLSLYLTSLIDIIHMSQGKEGTKKIYLDNRKQKKDRDLIIAISYEKACFFLGDANYSIEILFGFIKSLVHCMDATVRYTLDKYHVEGGGSVGIEGSLGIGPRASNDDNWKPPLQKVLELIKVDNMVRLGEWILKTTKETLFKMSSYAITVLFEEMWSSEKHRNKFIGFMEVMADRWKDYTKFENLSKYPERFSTTINELMKRIKLSNIKRSLFQKIPHLQTINEFKFLESRRIVVKHHALHRQKGIISNQICSQGPYGILVGKLNEMNTRHRFLCGKLLNVINPAYSEKVDSLKGGFCNICMQGVDHIHWWMCDNCGEGITCKKCAAKMASKAECPYCKKHNDFFSDRPETTAKSENIDRYNPTTSLVRYCKEGIRPYHKKETTDTYGLYFSQLLLTFYAMFIPCKNADLFVRNLYRFTDGCYGKTLDGLQLGYGHIIKKICETTKGCTIPDVKRIIRNTTMHLREDEADRIIDVKGICNSKISLIPYSLEDKRKAEEYPNIWPRAGHVWALKKDTERQILIRDMEDFEEIIDADKGLSKGYRLYHHDELFFPYRKMISIRYDYTVTSEYGDTIGDQKFINFHRDWKIISRIEGDNTLESHVWNPLLTRDEKICLKQFFRRTVLNWGEVIKMCEVNRSEGDVLAKSMLEYGPKAPKDYPMYKDVVGVYCPKPDEQYNTFKPVEQTCWELPLYNILRQKEAFSVHAWGSLSSNLCPMFLRNLTRVYNDYTDFKQFQDDHYFIFSDSPLVVLEEFVRKKDGLKTNDKIRFYIMGSYRDINYKEKTVLLDGTLRDMEAEFCVSDRNKVICDEDITSIIAQYKTMYFKGEFYKTDWSEAAKLWQRRGKSFKNPVLKGMVNRLRKKQHFFFLPLGYTVNDMLSPRFNEKVTSFKKNELLRIHKPIGSEEKVVCALNDVEKIDEREINVKKLTMKQEKSYTIEHRTTICVDGKMIEDRKAIVLEKSDLLCIVYYSFKQDPTKPTVGDYLQDRIILDKCNNFLVKQFVSIYEPSKHNIKICKIKCDHIREKEYGMEVAPVGFMLFDLSWIFNKLLNGFEYFRNSVKIYKGDEEWTERDVDSYSMLNGDEICVKDDKRLASDGIVADSFTFIERKIYQTPLLIIDPKCIKSRVNYSFMPKSLRRDSEKLNDLIGKQLATTSTSGMFGPFLFAHHVVNGGFEEHVKVGSTKVPISSNCAWKDLCGDHCNNEAEILQQNAKQAYNKFDWSNFRLTGVDIDMGFRYFLADNRHRIDKDYFQLHDTSNSKSYPVLDNIIDSVRKTGCQLDRDWHRLCVAPPFEKDKLYMNDIIVELRSNNLDFPRGDIVLLLRITIEDFLLYFQEKNTVTASMMMDMDDDEDFL